MAITDEVPKSRITLTYRTDVQGEKASVALPFRMLIAGDFSNGTSEDRKKDLDQRQIRNLDGTNLGQVMKDMKMTLRLKAPNKVDPDRAGDEIDVELPIDSISSFDPAEIAKNVPKVRALLLLRKLLLEVQGNLDNRKEFRNLLRALASNEESVAALLKELEGFDSFKIPGGAKE